MFLLVKAGQPALAGSVLTAATTVIISTLTLVVGRYLERKRELESLHRDKKIPIYAKFLEGLFDAFFAEGGKKKQNPQRMVKFFRDWQREIVLWGGSDVVNTYIEWNRSLKQGEPNAATVYKTEELMLSIRRELGHDNNRIEKGSFIRFLLREADLFLKEAKKNPSITLAEISEIEARITNDRTNAC